MRKEELHPDRVRSDRLHVGIELELRAPLKREHQDEACEDTRRAAFIQHRLANANRREILQSFGIPAASVPRVEHFFSLGDYVRQNAEREFDSDPLEGCDGECFHYTSSSESTRLWVTSELTALTHNRSFKTVRDGSVRFGSSQCDAEVCWNYPATRECVKDNEKILGWLESEGLTFNESCGLHININNYLGVRAPNHIPTSALAFLFNFVAKSRATNQYCNRFAIAPANGTKYSMIFEQGDRLEFRFFSPTLKPEKLNFYVHLANVVYRRLAGKPARLSKKASLYFIEKMMNTNGLSRTTAEYSIHRVNNIPSMAVLAAQFAERRAS